MTTDLGGYLTAAMTAADQARDLIRTSRPGTVTEKADRDLVSDTDVVVERAVRSCLREATPAIPVLGEEEGGPAAGTGWLWALDPIDGTSNYAHGIPLCAASLALLRDGHPVLGVIDAPFLGERFHAVEGTGAWAGNRRLAVSATAAVRDAIVAIGDYATGHGAGRRNETQLAATVSLAARVHRLRMLGTAALDLAWTAAGRLDATITFSNNPWDTAAGVIIARESGAAVTDANGTPHTHQSAATIAAAPELLAQLIPLIQAARPDGTDTAAPHMTPALYADLDRILSRARYLAFELDGTVRDTATRAPTGYIHEALAACRDSGRIPAITATGTPSEVAGYLADNNLDELVRHVYMPASGTALSDLASSLSASPGMCAVITTTPSTIREARRDGYPTVGYAQSPGSMRELGAAGADSLVPSLADLTLRLRARPLASAFRAGDRRAW